MTNSTMEAPRSVADLPTPSLILELSRLRSNVQRMSSFVGKKGCMLRPHVKSFKSINVWEEVKAAGNLAGLTVSTLREAEYFFENGETDILYAVGIAPGKLTQVADLMKRGCDLKIILDSPEMAHIVAEKGREFGVSFKALVELDVDGHRSGVDPDDDVLIEIGSILTNQTGAELLGLMTHAGESYNCRSSEELLQAARDERDKTVAAAEKLRSAGISCPVVSIGSTPTALSFDHLRGVTEVRAGVYTFFDLVMSKVGVCTSSDIAISVLASVIGHQKSKAWAITDAGWMAMSSDLGVDDEDTGYGLVADLDGDLIGDLTVARANQEHGVVASKSQEYNTQRLATGDRIRILPNHACATAAQFDKYFVIEGNRVIAVWPRIQGW